MGRFVRWDKAEADPIADLKRSQAAVARRAFYRILGERIRARRKALKLTQAEVAQEIGVSRPALANIEVGRQSLFVHQLVMLATVLDMPVQQFVPHEEQEEWGHI